MASIWKSDRLIYRSPEPDDDAFLNTFNDDSESYSNATLRIAAPPGLAQAKEWREHLQSKALLGVIICLKPSRATTTQTTSPSATDSESIKPVPIGTIGLSNTTPDRSHHRNAMIGINLRRAYHGQGYGSEAILWILRWSFKYANLHRVDIGAVGYNPRALKLYEKLGFIVEGRKREAVYFEGKYWDLIDMGMLKSEWIEKYDRPMTES